jgi:putative transposase
VAAGLQPAALSAKRERADVYLQMRDPYFTSRDLPHYTPNDRPYFVTFNLEGAIPRERREAYMSNFMEYDNLLHVAESHLHLKDPRLAELVFDKLRAMEYLMSELHAFTVMPNHVHFLATLKDDDSLSFLMKKIKGSTARTCNKLLNQTGTFWQEERHDRVMRRGEFWPTLRYILLNPVRARLVSAWKDYPWTYVKPELLRELLDHRGGLL